MTNEPAQIEALALQTATVPGMYSVLVTDPFGFPLTEIVNQGGTWVPRYNLSRVDLPAHQGPDSLFEIAPYNAAQRDFLSGRSGTMLAWQRITAEQPLGWVRIKFRMDRFETIAADIRAQAFKAVALGICATLALMWLLLQPTLRALRDASDFAARLDTMQGARLKVSRRATEIERLGEALNVVSQRLLEQHVDLTNQKFALDQHAIVSITDLSGTIVYANERFCQISGYARAELLGQNHRIVNSGEHPPPFFEDLWHTISQGQVWHGDIKNRKKDGSHYWVNATIVPLLGRDGLPHHYIGIRTDITVNKTLEQSLHAAKEQAETAAQVKGQFLANMSHEIRTPMNAILGMLKLLQHAELNTRQQDYASKAEGAAQSLLALVNDILDFSKIEAGKMKLDAHPFELDKLLRDLSVIASANVGSKPVELRFDVDAQAPAWLRGDALRLQQVLINLCSNAIKFTPKGQVLVSVRLQARSADHATLRFSVSDTGIGIAPENQRHIFEGFSQAEASTTRRYGGTGLGLSISAQLVAMMGGALQLQSALGQGSTFWFEVTLPMEQPSVAAASEDAAALHSADSGAPQPLTGLRLLVVEDNPINQQVAQELLQAQGAHVALADNGQLGVQAVQQALDAQQPFDLVLMDLQMPVMDGYQATRLLRQRPQLHQLPIVAMTANAMDEDRQACLAAGMNEHIGKPFNLTDLVALVLRLTAHAGTTQGNLRDASRSLDLPHPAQAVDSVAAQQRLGNNRSLYARVVQSFLSNAATMPAQVLTQLRDQQLAPALDLLHTFKGLAATAGAADLAGKVQQLERDLRASLNQHLPVDAHAIHAALVSALAEPMAALQEMALGLDANAPTPAPNNTPARAPADATQWQELLALLKASDMRSLEMFEQLQAQTSAAQTSTLSRIGTALEQLDFAAAVQATQTLLSESLSRSKHHS